MCVCYLNVQSKTRQGYFNEEQKKEQEEQGVKQEEQQKLKRKRKWDQLYHNTLNDTTSDCVSKSRGRTALVKDETSTMILLDPSRDLIASAELDTNASIFSI